MSTYERLFGENIGHLIWDNSFRKVFRKVILGRFQAAVKLFYKISWLYYNDHMVYQDRMEGRQ